MAKQPALCVTIGPMLKIRFFNVAEGDSILLEYSGGDAPFRVLVDCGRNELPESEGSLRMTAAEHLKRLGLSRIDALVITHLHVDHLANLPEIMKSVRFGRIYSTFYPADPAVRLQQDPTRLKPVRDLLRDLNTWAECVQAADAAGTERILLTEDTRIPMEDAYGSVFIRLPNANSLSGQNLVYSSLCAGLSVPESLINWAAQSRNPNSLRLRVTYAGRTILLDGDYYAADAEKEVQVPCDILKAAHHGDRKSMTAKLAAALRPKYAVISCKREYDAVKDRPSRQTADLLRQYGASVYYTDCFAEEGCEPSYHEELVFTVMEDGRIIPPSQ